MLTMSKALSAYLGETTVKFPDPTPSRGWSSAIARPIRQRSLRPELSAELSRVTRARDAGEATKPKYVTPTIATSAVAISARPRILPATKKEATPVAARAMIPPRDSVWSSPIVKRRTRPARAARVTRERSVTSKKAANTMAGRSKAANQFGSPAPKRPPSRYDPDPVLLGVGPAANAKTRLMRAPTMYAQTSRLKSRGLRSAE